MDTKYIPGDLVIYTSSDTEYLTKETCGEYLKSTKEHYFSKRV